jgi:hypothetical protein
MVGNTKPQLISANKNYLQNLVQYATSKLVPCNIGQIVVGPALVGNSPSHPTIPILLSPQNPTTTLTTCERIRIQLFSSHCSSRSILGIGIVVHAAVLVRRHGTWAIIVSSSSDRRSHWNRQCWHWFYLYWYIAIYDHTYVKTTANDVTMYETNGTVSVDTIFEVVDDPSN